MITLCLYLSAAFIAVLPFYWFILRPRHLSWGATDAEVDQFLPGDELTINPPLNATHAITINAPIEDVWPWIAQIGQTRGGFYSYTWLENLVGCRVRNADQIRPEWQILQSGDKVWLHPKAPPLKVRLVDPGRSVVLGNTWAFVLRPIDQWTTRLIVRGRGEFEPDLKNRFLNFLLWRVVFEPAHFIMERKMMLGIKKRAEAYRYERMSKLISTLNMHHLENQ